MIYPDIDELINLRFDANKLIDLHKYNSKTRIQGDYLSSFRGHGIEFDGIREYVIGDDIRSIDWNITARTGSPHIKLFREQARLNIMICVDMNRAMQFGTRGTFKSVQAAKCASILGWYALNKKDNLSAYLFGNINQNREFIGCKRPKHTLHKMLNIFTQKQNNSNIIKLDDGIDFLCKRKITKSIIFIISDFIRLNDPFYEKLSLLKQKHEVILISVNDKADMNIPMLKATFSDGRDRIFINSNPESCINYKNRWRRNRKLLQDTTSSLGIKTINITTDENVIGQLLNQLI